MLIGLWFSVHFSFACVFSLFQQKHILRLGSIAKSIITIFVFISYDINIYHNVHLPLTWREMLSTWDHENGCMTKLPFWALSFTITLWCVPQPSSSCSFDGSLKSESSDSEPRWPEVPPVLNQNEDRRRNKYLRKDYLKVHTQARTCSWVFSRSHILFDTCISPSLSLSLVLWKTHTHTHKCDPLCEIQAKVSKSNETTSIKVGFQPLISL